MKHKFQRSKLFPDVIFSNSIPRRLIVEEEGRISIYGGRINEKEKWFETGTKPLKTYTRLDNAKNGLIKMEEIRIKKLLDSRQKVA